MPDKIKAIQEIAPPTNPKQLRSFLGMVNFYRDMWKHRSHMLTPLTPLTIIKSKKNWIWLSEHQDAFDKIKETLARDVLLAYPDFNLVFEIYTDASKTQLGAVIV